jgi:hypothetical protein
MKMWHLLDTHAGAIQAICAAIGLFIGIVGTLLVLISLQLARRQTAAAASQFTVAQKQYSESLRPIIVVSVVAASPDYLDLKLTNDGNGPALDMDGYYTQTANLLGAKSSCVVATTYENTNNGIFPFAVRYKSLDGRAFETSVMICAQVNCLHTYRELA